MQLHERIVILFFEDICSVVNAYNVPENLCSQVIVKVLCYLLTSVALLDSYPSLIIFSIISFILLLTLFCINKDSLLFIKDSSLFILQYRCYYISVILATITC